MRTIAVIGANYGDEGKGNITAYLAKELIKDNASPLVVRCNGGSQAGHTVNIGKKQHIFNHIGSGSFTGSNTYLASYFIINPLNLENELKELKYLNTYPTIFTHPDCRITTIYDMAINSLAELARGENRHGSCGLGINETVTRSASGYNITASMLNLGVYAINEHLKKIQSEWIPHRLQELNILNNTFINRSVKIKEQVKLYREALEHNPIAVASNLCSFGRNLLFINPKTFYKFNSNLIIEGAQGLQLDEFMGTYPYVTRSITGLPAALKAAYECGRHEIEPIYVTRTYLTRHGNGPLEYQDEFITENKLYDKTNIQNEWQGTLRYAPLNITRLKEFIHKDLERSSTVSNLFGIKIKSGSIFLSCFDQIGETVNFIVNDNIIKILKENIQYFIQDVIKLPISYISNGPSINDVQKINIE